MIWFLLARYKTCLILPWSGSIAVWWWLHSRFSPSRVGSLPLEFLFPSSSAAPPYHMRTLRAATGVSKKDHMGRRLTIWLFVIAYAGWSGNIFQLRLSLSIYLSDATSVFGLCDVWCGCVWNLIFGMIFVVVCMVRGFRLFMAWIKLSIWYLCALLCGHIRLWKEESIYFL